MFLIHVGLNGILIKSNEPSINEKMVTDRNECPEMIFQGNQLPNVCLSFDLIFPNFLFGL